MLVKKAVFILSVSLSCHIAIAQSAKYDSLKNLLASAKEDSLKYKILSELISDYIWNYPDTALPYIHQSISLAKQMKSDLLLRRTYVWYMWYFIGVGDYAQALFVAQEALKLAEKSGDPFALADSYDGLATVYDYAGDYNRSLALSKKGLSVLESKWKPPFKKDVRIRGSYARLYNGLTSTYNKLGLYDSALVFARLCDEYSRTRFNAGWSAASFLFGDIYVNMKDYQKAILYYRRGIDQALRDGNSKDLMDNYTGLSNTFKMIGKYDSSI